MLPKPGSRIGWAAHPQRRAGRDLHLGLRPRLRSRPRTTNRQRPAGERPTGHREPPSRLSRVKRRHLTIRRHKTHVSSVLEVVGQMQDARDGPCASFTMRRWDMKRITRRLTLTGLVASAVI